MLHVDRKFSSAILLRSTVLVKYSAAGMTYSWVRNNYSLSRTHVARSTEPRLARFFLYWSVQNIKTCRARFSWHGVTMLFVLKF